MTKIPDVKKFLYPLKNTIFLLLSKYVIEAPSLRELSAKLIEGVHSPGKAAKKSWKTVK